MADDPKDGAPGAEEDAPLSQADIDAALAGAGGASTPVESAEAGEQAASQTDAGAFTQADIDAALAAGSAGSAPEAEAPAAPDTRVDTAGRPFDEAAAAMAAAIEEEKAAAAEAARAGPSAQPLELPDFTGDSEDETLNHGIELLHNVGLRVKIELGRTRMFVEDVLKLTDGSVVELDKLAGDPVDVFANDQLIARGEVLILNDNFCVRVSEIIAGGAATALKT